MIPRIGDFVQIKTNSGATYEGIVLQELVQLGTTYWICLENIGSHVNLNIDYVESMSVKEVEPLTNEKYEEPIKITKENYNDYDQLSKLHNDGVKQLRLKIAQKLNNTQVKNLGSVYENPDFTKCPEK